MLCKFSVNVDGVWFHCEVKNTHVVHRIHVTNKCGPGHVIQWRQNPGQPQFKQGGTIELNQPGLMT